MSTISHSASARAEIEHLRAQLTASEKTRDDALFQVEAYINKLVAAEQKVKELEADLAKRDEEAKAAEEEIEECRKFMVAGAAHPLVAQSIEEQFNWHGPLAFLKMAADTIKAQQEEIAALRTRSVAATNRRSKR